jgi:hypothetical protein
LYGDRLQNLAMRARKALCTTFRLHGFLSKLSRMKLDSKVLFSRRTAPTSVMHLPRGQYPRSARKFTMSISRPTTTPSGKKQSPNRLVSSRRCARAAGLSWKSRIATLILRCRPPMVSPSGGTPDRPLSSTKAATIVSAPRSTLNALSHHALSHHALSHHALSHHARRIRRRSRTSRPHHR